MENINTGRKVEPAVVQADADLSANVNVQEKATFKNLLSPKTSFQWVAFLILIFGIVGGGAVGGGIGALISMKIYNLDRTEKSTGKKIGFTLLYLVLGSIAYAVIYIILISLLSYYLPAENIDLYD